MCLKNAPDCRCATSSVVPPSPGCRSTLVRRLGAVWCVFVEFSRRYTNVPEPLFMEEVLVHVSHHVGIPSCPPHFDIQNSFGGLPVSDLDQNYTQTIHQSSSWISREWYGCRIGSSGGGTGHARYHHKERRSLRLSLLAKNNQILKGTAEKSRLGRSCHERT